MDSRREARYPHKSRNHAVSRELYLDIGEGARIMMAKAAPAAERCEIKTSAPANEIAISRA